MSLELFHVTEHRDPLFMNLVGYFLMAVGIKVQICRLEGPSTWSNLMDQLNCGLRGEMSCAPLRDPQERKSRCNQILKAHPTKPRLCYYNGPLRWRRVQ
ncbi:hypothetical protein AAFF_G00268860 [Aldrovandia affinis]|uniref:Uncharacterized protein n=1 Tax=Aldrovandia affinis TaxID=143900 RepID=A0AAD7STE7_9TELE|nr:hypothetical protein AAFF_G00268860 [Aldrovandia affinis]